MGSRRVVAQADTTGNNTGFWTVDFDPATMALHWTQYEVYKMVVTLAQTAGEVAWTVYIGTNVYEGYQASIVATWSDPQPMIVPNGETIYFYFDEPSSDGTPPVVTIWIQVDEDYARRIR